MMFLKKQAGTLIEVIVAMTIISIIVPSLIIMSLGSHSGALRSEDSLEATALAQEGLEAIRAIRDYDWDDLEVGVHGVTDTSGYWELTEEPNEDLLDKYTRSIVIDEISSYKKEAVVTVGWELREGTDKEIVMTTRLTNWKVLSWIETLEADFDAGTLVDVDSVNLEGGELQLDSLPDWSAPNMIGSYATDEDYNGFDLFVDGNYAYLGTDRPNQGSDPGFYILDISTPGSTTLAGYFNVNADVNSVYVSGNYAYLATGLNGKELLVLDITNKADPIEVGYYDSDENKDGTAVFVDGYTAYLGTENNFGWSDHEFYALDVSNLSAITLLDSYDIYNTVDDIYVYDDIAYAATARLFDELILFNVSNPGNIGYMSSFNEFGYFEGYGITVSGDYAYFVTSDGWFGSNDFYIVNISNPYSPNKTGSLDLDTNNNEICISGDYAYVGTDRENEELTIIDISNLSSPSEYAYYDADGDVNGVYCSGGYVFLATENTGYEFQIISPGASGDRFEEEGTFTSQAFDTGSSSTSYFTLSWTEEGTGDIQYQLKTADTEGNLSSANWVGPGGTGAAFYTVSGDTIDLDPNRTGTRWMQYQASFSGDGTNSPILKDVTIDYVQ